MREVGDHHDGVETTDLDPLNYVKVLAVASRRRRKHQVPIDGDGRHGGFVQRSTEQRGQVDEGPRRDGGHQLVRYETKPRTDD